LIKKIRIPNADRILYVAEAFRRGKSVDEIYEICKIDKWFLNQIQQIVELEKEITPQILENEELLRKAKTYGFSDRMIAKLIGKTEEDVYNARKKLNIEIDYNEVDTCAAEFDTTTSYLYSTVNVTKNVPLRKPDFNDKKVLILGGGPNRIGQGIEFDYCCVHAAFALNDLGVKTLMYNCNPEMSFLITTRLHYRCRLHFPNLSNPTLSAAAPRICVVPQHRPRCNPSWHLEIHFSLLAKIYNMS
jgi:carbamoyl-phosphate synthase large subunit